MANVLSYIGYSHAPSGSEDYSFKYVATFTGSYTITVPETLNFLTATNANGLELNGFVPSGTQTITPEYTANLGGYTINVTPLVNGSLSLKFYSAGGTELTTGAYPAGITAGSVTFRINVRG